MDKFKIIKQYDRYYLCIHPAGYKECFSKYEYRPTEDGYIIKKHSLNTGRLGATIDPKKVNRNFNKITKKYQS